MKNIITILLLFLVTGCTITQTTKPAHIQPNEEVCIIKNPKVRTGFHDAIIEEINNRNLKPRTVNNGFAEDNCKWSIKYSANWSWDIALYMAYAEIKIFHHDAIQGEAIYDSSEGGLNLKKYQKARAKVTDMLQNTLYVNQAYN